VQMAGEEVLSESQSVVRLPSFTLTALQRDAFATRPSLKLVLDKIR